MYAKIKADIKEAMKSKNVVKRNCLKMVIDKARVIQKEKNPIDTPEVISDEIIVQAINKEVKQLAQTLDSIKGETDSKFVEIAQRTNDEIAILCSYLPAQMTRKEVEEAVYRILTVGNYESFGLKMRMVMAELNGKADNKLIKEVVETYK